MDNANRPHSSRRIPARGGKETLVMKAAGLSDCWSWALATGGIYFTSEWSDELSYYEFSSRKTFLISHQGYAGSPAVAPDGKSVVFSQVDDADQTIMLVNHFR
jgi:Tol biopolymer transport system component